MTLASTHIRHGLSALAVCAALAGLSACGSDGETTTRSTTTETTGGVVTPPAAPGSTTTTTTTEHRSDD
jgi:hypothetical protein